MHSLVRSLLRGQTHMLIKPCGVIAAHALNTRHDLIFFRENCPLGQKLNRGALPWDILLVLRI